MKIHDVPQGELEWHRLRLGIPTASEFKALCSPLFHKSDSAGVLSYLAQKIAEKWQGHPLPGFTSFATEQGSILEEDALPWFAMEYDADVRRVGFITSDDGRCGCSPDGLIGDDCGLEIKCPQADTHVSYLLAGTLPKAYVAQVHFSLYVTGFPRWKFLSYRKGFPKLVLTIDRDEAVMEKIGAILTSFYALFDDAMQKMEAMK